VTASGDGLAVAVADDGLGWCEAAEQAAATCRSDHAVNENSTGIGLRAAHDRLARLGGTLSVVGNEDGGITMRAWIPLS
jgi:signal transduction histidine kinase